MLREFNRMHDNAGARVAGKLLYHGVDLYGPEVRRPSPAPDRRVFQKQNPFRRALRNIAYGRAVTHPRQEAAREWCEVAALRGLWDEVKDRSKSRRWPVGRPPTAVHRAPRSPSSRGVLMDGRQRLDPIPPRGSRR